MTPDEIQAAAKEVLLAMKEYHATPEGQAIHRANERFAAEHDGSWPDSFDWFRYQHGFGPDPLAGYRDGDVA